MNANERETRYGDAANFAVAPASMEAFRKDKAIERPLAYFGGCYP